MNSSPSSRVARDRPRLDQRLELPRLRPVLVVRRRSSSRVRLSRPDASLGPEVGVGAEHDAVGRRRRHGRERAPRAVALRVVGVALVHEQHVDVARVVELAPAELAHARSTANGAVGPTSSSAARGTTCGERGELAPHRGEVGDAEQVACCDPQELAPLPAPQHAVVVRGSCACHRTRGTLGEVALRSAERRRVVAERIEQRRVGDDRRTTATATRTRARPDLARSSGRVPSSSASSGWASTTRDRRRCARSSASAERSMSVGERGRVERSRAPSGMPRSVAYPGGDAQAPRRGRAARPRGRRPRGRTRRGSSRPTTGPRRAGCDLVGVPRARGDGVPARGPAPAPGVRADRQRGGREDRGPHGPGGRGRRVPRGGPRPVQRRGGVRGRAGARRVPQAPAAQLRGVRRAALLRAVDGRRPVVRRRRACGSRCRSARTRGARAARSSPRPRVAPSWW